MTRVVCNISTSVDGFVAGPRQSLDNPIGVGGMRLHDWHLNPQGEDQAVIDEWQQTPGAYVMGRNMFGPGRGEWDLDWKGWWGDEPRKRRRPSRRSMRRSGRPQRSHPGR